ncbi:4-hydroxy-tetrahydrodipicolinate synthase [Cryomorpha ignava]|uniref:4-hydroxy-tetrahydrodipicolinate synthase n=1 Tax=Cryomorpha ignava TaxID=101383 RepID=A0A7K3WTF4_9FLAO|nr:4-hydroxy-tetrahydrodipicolinate synthase [Cryomorpha ignava]NEN24973.1 4-hydroxy-tetrahydrodipicolinate synthase [Cryomorpha ignava]
MQELKGLGVAMVTPFQEDGSVHYGDLDKLIKHLHNGADYLVVMGTTGEAITLSEEEQLAILDFVIEKNAGKLPIVYGMGGNNTADIVRQMKAFKSKGVTAFLSASPAYNKPTQEGIYRHYRALSEASPLPIILYNVPGRTASNVLPATVLRIAKECKSIVAIKEAAGIIEQVMELSRILPKSFLLLSGDDALALPHMACGGHGIISVVGNAYPAFFSSIISASANGDFEKARENHYKLLPLIANLFKEGNPGGIKEVLMHMGICQNHMRLPLYPVSNDLSNVLSSAVAELG